MTSRSPFQVPERPEALQRPAALPFWGERRPPENFTDVFRAYAAEEEERDGEGAKVQTRQVATLRIYGPIYDGWFGVSARVVAQALDELGDVDEIRVRINSPGGDAWEGMAIMNLLRAHDADVVAVVDGVAASAASVVAAGADRTVMSPGTQLMIHDASTFAYGPAATMRKAATFLDSVSNAYAELYADVAGQSAEYWRELMIETTWYTAAEAVESGLADEVAIVKDSGPSDTPADEPPAFDDEDDVEAQWDLSMYPYAGRSKAPAPRSPAASAGGSTPTTGRRTAVAFSDEQLTDMRRQLGIAEDADEATILAALTEALDERADDTAPTTPDLPEGMVLVESSVLDELRTGAQQGVEARRQQQAEARDRTIDAAIRAGKTTPSRRAHWVTSWDADPEGTRELLDKLEPGLVPTSELGHDNPVDEQKTEDDAVYAAVFGDEKKGA